MRTHRPWLSTAGFCGLGLVSLFWSWAALEAQDDAASPAAAAGAGQEEIVIKREAIQLADPRAYKVALSLVPIRTFDFTAPIDGYVKSVSGKPAEKLKKESNIVQMDNQAAATIVKRAKANVLAARLEKKIADGKGDMDQVALAAARLEAAEADLELAQLQERQLSIRAPFEGELIRIKVQEGQYVHAGEVLGTLIDTTKLQVELPVDRDATKVGSSISFKIEATEAQGKVTAILPLISRFDPLRELSEGLATAVVEVDNASHKLMAGQSVHVDLIPAAPVAEITTAAVSNQADGNRKVQVLRDNVVRTITVAVHTRIGTDRVFVSGPFRSGDELILSSSKELADGTPVKAVVAARAPAAGAPAAAAAPTAAGKAATKSGTVDGF